MSDWFGVFSWPKLIEVLPNYLSAIAALSAVGVAYFQISSARRETSERSAISNLLDTTTSVEWQVVRVEFINFRSRLATGKISIEAFSDALQSKDAANPNLKEFLGSFRMIMNSYEVMALGILSGSLSEKIYREYMRGMFVSDWKAVKGVVDQLRKDVGNPKIYNYCEQLFEKWATPLDSPLEKTGELGKQSQLDSQT